MTIKQKISTVLATIGVMSFVALAMPMPQAFALNKAPTGGGDVNTTNCPKTSIIKVACDKSGGAITALLLMAINILAVGVGVAAVGGVVYAAILYATAEDKPAQVSKAKTIIFNVVIGVAAYFLMFSFLQFLVPGGVFH